MFADVLAPSFSKFLFDAYIQVVEGGGAPPRLAASRTVFIPKSSTLDDQGREVRSPDALRPLTHSNCDCTFLTTAGCIGLQQYSVSCIHPGQRCVSTGLMTDDIFEIET